MPLHKGKGHLYSEETKIKMEHEYGKAKGEHVFGAVVGEVYRKNHHGRNWNATCPACQIGHGKHDH